MLEWAAWWTAAVMSIFVSAICSGLELGLYSLNRVRLDLRAARVPPDSQARIIREEIEHPGRTLAVLLIANNIVGATAAVATTALMQASGYNAVTIAILNTLILGPIMFVAGDALPKEVFRMDADRLTPMFARPLRVARGVLTALGILPVVEVFTSAAESMLKLPREAVSDARQRIAQLLKEGAGHGVLSESQLSLVDRALVFRNITVTDEMTPWRDVRVVPATSERARLLDLVGPSPHSAFPCVDKTGKAVGVIRHLDLYVQTRKSTAELMKPVARFKPMTPAREALAALRSSRSGMGVVEDEQGRPLGIVTAKDLVEPLTGELAGL